MKRVTASGARRNWFRLLDEVAAGQTVVIERNGRRIVIKRQADRVRERVPSYRAVLRGPANDADTWTWEWTAPGKLKAKKRRAR